MANVYPFAIVVRDTLLLSLELQGEATACGHTDCEVIRSRCTLLLDNVICWIGVPASLVAIAVERSLVLAASVKEVKRYLNGALLTIRYAADIPIRRVLILASVTT